MNSTETQAQRLRRYWHLYSSDIREWILGLLLGIVLIAILATIREGISRFGDALFHSRFWLGLSPAKQHLTLGIVLTGIGGFWMYRIFRRSGPTRALRQTLLASILTIYGVHELFETLVRS